MSKSITTMTEGELRKYECHCPSNQKELLSLVSKLLNREHDYGTCVYAVSVASVAMFDYMARKLGITGFQASCAVPDMISRIRGTKHGFRILNYENLLYPQYANSEHFPTYDDLIKQNKDWLSKEAKKLLKGGGITSLNVRKHWKWLASLKEES